MGRERTYEIAGQKVTSGEARAFVRRRDGHLCHVCGYRVGMSRAVVVKLLEADGGPDWGYRPTQDDAPWIADLEAKRAKAARAAATA